MVYVLGVPAVFLTVVGVTTANAWTLAIGLSCATALIIYMAENHR